MVRCKACKVWVWNFNLENHYASAHKEIAPSEDEKKAMSEITTEFAQQNIDKINKQTSRGGATKKKA